MMKVENHPTVELRSMRRNPMGLGMGPSFNFQLSTFN